MRQEVSYTRLAVPDYEDGFAISKNGVAVKSEGNLVISDTNGYKYTAGEAIVMADKIERYMGE